MPPLLKEYKEKVIAKSKSKRLRWKTPACKRKGSQLVLTLARASPKMIADIQASHKKQDTIRGGAHLLLQQRHGPAIPTVPVRPSQCFCSLWQTASTEDRHALICVLQ
jgi:hypothetical protein